MTQKQYRYIFGPVYSWRLGSSLGIDPISTDEKTCNFDCIYCQLGKTVRIVTDRRIFVPAQDILREIKTLGSLDIDYITLTSCGEPTLAANLGEIIEGIRVMRSEKIAVITNSSLIWREDVCRDLSGADCILAKLDAFHPQTFREVNRCFDDISISAVVDGLKKFRSLYKGKLAIQIMLMAENQKDIKNLAGIIAEIKPDEVQVNTPLRPCGITPLSQAAIREAKKYFQDVSVVSVYDQPPKDFKPFDEAATTKRHGQYQEKNV